MPLFGTRGAASVTGFGGLAKLGYLLRNSLRFRASNSNYLNRTFGTPTNNKVWTWSAWVKRGSLSLADADHLFMGTPTDVGGNPSTYARLVFETDGTLRLQSASSASEAFTSSAVFRDPAAWYHIVLYMDAVNTTVRCYVNGTEIAYASRSNPTNTNTAINGSGNYHRMGFFRTAEPRPMDGYMAEVNFIDGQALTPSSFGKTDPATGQWIPIKFGGAYGTNGFYLPFTNTTSTSTLGNDFSGNSNTWTVNNFSLTAGVTYDSMTDVPTNTSETTANYCVINSTTTQPTGWGAATTFSNANLTGYMPDSGTDAPAYGTIALPRSGKWYWEVIITNSTVPGAVGVSESSMARPDTTGPICRMLYSGGGTGVSFASNGFTNSGSYTFFGNATLGIACDMDNGAIYFAVNGTYVNSGVPTSGASKTGAIFTDLLSASPGGGSWLPMSYGYLGHVHNHNYGQRPFAYSAPSGYKTLNTFNLP